MNVTLNDVISVLGIGSVICLYEANDFIGIVPIYRRTFFESYLGRKVISMDTCKMDIGYESLLVVNITVDIIPFSN